MTSAAAAPWGEKGKKRKDEKRERMGEEGRKVGAASAHQGKKWKEVKGVVNCLYNTKYS